MDFGEYDLSTFAWSVDVRLRVARLFATPLDIGAGGGAVSTTDPWIFCALRLTSTGTSVRFYTLDTAGNLSNETPDVGASEFFAVGDIGIGSIVFEPGQARCAADTEPASVVGTGYRFPSVLIEGQTAVVEAVTVYMR
jgi:hypothetical protein